MRRYWALVLASAFGWVAFSSCVLDVKDVRQQPTDASADSAGGTDGGGGSGGTAGTGGASGADAGGDSPVDDSGIYTLPPGCLNTAGVDAHCNPLTNEGCAGSLGCDTSFDTKPVLVCLPNDGIQAGGTCNNVTGPYCAPKLTCSGAPGICAKFCCANADCPSNQCFPFDITLGTLGYCLPSADSGA